MIYGPHICRAIFCLNKFAVPLGAASSSCPYHKKHKDKPCLRSYINGEHKTASVN